MFQNKRKFTFRRYSTTNEDILTLFSNTNLIKFSTNVHTTTPLSDSATSMYIIALEQNSFFNSYLMIEKKIIIEE